MKYLNSFNFIRESKDTILNATKSNASEVVDQIKSKLGFKDFMEAAEDLTSMIEVDDSDGIFTVKNGRWKMYSISSRIRKDSRVDAEIYDYYERQLGGSEKYRVIRRINRFIQIAQVADKIGIYYSFDVRIDKKLTRSGIDISESIKNMILNLKSRSKLEGIELEYFRFNWIGSDQNITSSATGSWKPIDEIDFSRERNYNYLVLRFFKNSDPNPFGIQDSRFDTESGKKFQKLADKYRISNPDREEIIKLSKDL
jgi:hypothetical protein